MSNALIDLEETGTCRCGNLGFRARGARDIEGTAERTGVFRKTFHCPECLAAAAQRSLVAFSGVQRVKRNQPIAP